MARLDGYRFRVVSKILTDNGFVRQESHSSHIKFRRGSETLIVTAPTINRVIFKRLCKEHNIPLDL